ncbi:MAG: proton-conducting transporter membrane subunit, partial [Clostridia bacterium]|nr:proton-conducting transporter membrane subunit [Clostridia bacterium]
MISSITANLPVFVVIAPLFVAFILTTFARRIRLVEGLVIFIEVLGLTGAGFLAVNVFIKNIPIIYQMGGWPAPWGIELRIGNLSAFFLLVVAFVSVPVSLFAVNNLSDEVGGKERVTRFYVLYLLLGGAMAGMAVTNDLFNVFVLVEVATLSCCGLVSSRNRQQAAEAAFTYLIMATLGSTLVLGGIGFIYIITGHLNMGFAYEELNRIWQNSPHVVWMAFSFMLVGFGVKSALFPLHIWLPDAHSAAPSPASAILSGVAVKGYLICLLKILYRVFGHTLMQEFAVHRILVLAGTVAIIAGSILALTQVELKRRLAFSTVAQVGYIILGMGLVNIKGLTGTLFYLASHAVIKSTLFLAAGAIIAATGKKNIHELAG